MPLPQRAGWPPASKFDFLGFFTIVVRTGTPSRARPGQLVDVLILTVYQWILMAAEPRECEQKGAEEEKSPSICVWGGKIFPFFII